MAIKDIKVWKNATKTDTRIYVHTDDNREGCLYRTGNRWHQANSIDGNLTEAEWDEARAIAVWDGVWHTIYENEMPARVAALNAMTVEAAPRVEASDEESVFEYDQPIGPKPAPEYVMTIGQREVGDFIRVNGGTETREETGDWWIVTAAWHEDEFYGLSAELATVRWPTDEELAEFLKPTEDDRLSLVELMFKYTSEN